MSHLKAMKWWRVSFEGIVFLLLGVALVIGSVLMLSHANEYQAVARIKVNRELDSSPVADRQKLNDSYDPYFIQTEFEVIQSEAVLRKVAESMYPDRISQSGIAGLINAIRRRMDLRVGRNTELIEIRITNPDPVEAAKLANAIAQSSQAFRQKQNPLPRTEKQNASAGVSSFQVDIVDTAAIPARPIRPNRPLGATVLVFGSLLAMFALYVGSHQSED
jgi:capsular polysaccharide biosynthesis protein